MSDELLLSIEKLVYGGDGLTHADGNTVFVPYVLPGEGVRAATKTKKKKLIWTKLVEVTSPSAERIAPACPHFQVCGGCHYQHIPAAEQVRLKIEILRETLSRLGGVQWNGEITAHSGEPYGYRNRAQWAVRSGMPRALGYFLPESSVILPIDTCPILSPRLLETFTLLQEMARGGKLPAGILEIEAFTDSADEKIALNVAFDKFPAPAGRDRFPACKELPRLESLLLLDQKKDRFELTGPGFLIHEVGGFKYQVSHLSFFQVNRFLTEDLLKTVTAGAKGDSRAGFVCGRGIFYFAAGADIRTGRECGRQSGGYAGFVCEREKCGSGSRLSQRACGRIFEKNHRAAGFCCSGSAQSGAGNRGGSGACILGSGGDRVFVLRPFDAGQGFGGIDWIAAKDLGGQFTRVAARRLRAEIGAGSAAGVTNRYEITEMAMFDLFPQTFHIETLVRLRRVA